MKFFLSVALLYPEEYASRKLTFAFLKEKCFSSREPWSTPDAIQRLTYTQTTLRVRGSECALLNRAAHPVSYLSRQNKEIWCFFLFRPPSSIAYLLFVVDVFCLPVWLAWRHCRAPATLFFHLSKDTTEETEKESAGQRIRRQQTKKSRKEKRRK